MTYRYLEDIAIADVAFIAQGITLEELFLSACDATMNIMVEDLQTIEKASVKSIKLESDTLDLLLFNLLQELVFYKDAEQLLLRVSQLSIKNRDGHFTLSADMYGNKINPEKHNLIVDVKAVTLHRFQVKEVQGGWEAQVILDI